MKEPSLDLTLNSKDICDIIKQCAKSKVSIFKLGDLSIEFSTPEAHQEISIKSNSEHKLNLSENTQQEFNYDDELQHSLLDLEDPEAYEELAMKEGMHVQRDEFE